MSGNPYGVRRATTADVDPLLDFVLHLLPEERLQPVSPSRVLEMIHRCADQRGAIAGVVDGADGIEATIALFVERMDDTDQEHIRIKWSIVHPEHRQTDHAQNLMKFAKWCCEQLGGRKGYQVPLLYEVLTKGELLGKMKLAQRSLPQVGATFAWGCIPQGQLDQLTTGGGQSKRWQFARRHQPSPILAESRARA